MPPASLSPWSSDGPRRWFVSPGFYIFLVTLTPIWAPPLSFWHFLVQLPCFLVRGSDPVRAAGGSGRRFVLDICGFGTGICVSHRNRYPPPPPPARHPCEHEEASGQLQTPRGLLCLSSVSL